MSWPFALSMWSSKFGYETQRGYVSLALVRFSQSRTIDDDNLEYKYLLIRRQTIDRFKYSSLSQFSTILKQVFAKRFLTFVIIITSKLDNQLIKMAVRIIHKFDVQEICQ